MSRPRTIAVLAAAVVAAGGGTAAAGARHVTIKNFTYQAKTITVSRGARVSWTDRDSANHTVTFKHHAGIANIRNGQTKSVTFARSGTYAYVCQYHPFMHGKVIVR